MKTKMLSPPLPRGSPTEPQGSKEPHVRTAGLSHGPPFAPGETDTEQRRDVPKGTRQGGSGLPATPG